MSSSLPEEVNITTMSVRVSGHWRSCWSTSKPEPRGNFKSSALPTESPQFARLVGRVMKAMIKMVKLDIKKLEQAARDNQADARGRYSH